MSEEHKAYEEKLARQQESRDNNFHSACVNAWFQTHMEKDKQLLTLSAAAIGLLMTLYDKLTLVDFVLWLCAGASYLVAIFIILIIFAQNASYLAVAASGNPHQDFEEKYITKSLKTKDAIVTIFFVLGVLLTVSLAVSKAGYNLVKSNNQNEAQENVHR